MIICVKIDVFMYLLFHCAFDIHVYALKIELRFTLWVSLSSMLVLSLLFPSLFLLLTHICNYWENTCKNCLPCLQFLLFSLILCLIYVWSGLHKCEWMHIVYYLSPHIFFTCVAFGHNVNKEPCQPQWEASFFFSWSTTWGQVKCVTMRFYILFLSSLYSSTNLMVHLSHIEESLVL